MTRVAHFDSPKTLGAVFVTLFFAYAYVHQTAFQGPIAVSRLNLLHSLFTHKTIRIDAYHENTPDKAIYEGHYYCDKAPGTVLLAIPAFTLGVGILKLGGTHLDSDSGWLISSWIACVGSLAIVVAIGGVALFLWLLNFVQPRMAYITTLAVFLGAAPFPYATLMMSHSLTVALLAVALWAANVGSSAETGQSRLVYSGDVFAGHCCGMAVACEFSAGIAVGAMLILLIVQNRKRVLSLASGMIPPLALVAAYNWACFGSPLRFAYHNQAVFTEMHEGFFGIHGLPSADAAFLLLFSASQGLFAWSPVLLLALVGYFDLGKKSTNLFLFTYFVPVFQVVAISSYFLPQAGGTMGPRLLSPILPLLALPTALGIARFPRTGVFLAFASILLTTFATLIDIVIPSSSHNPLLDFYLPAFLRQKFSHNLGHVLGLSGYLSLLPLFLIVGSGIWFTWRNLPALRK